MTLTDTTALGVKDLRSSWPRAEAMARAREAYARFVDALPAAEDAEAWARPTDCEGWTVRDLAGHVVGAMRSAASFRELVSQQREILRRAKADGGNQTDHMTAVQVEVAADLTPAELLAEARDLVDRATGGRRRVPAPMRRLVRFPVEVGSISERWPLGYLIDVILTRDAWLHRVDLTRALDTEMELTADHDGRIVADVVDEWLRRHGQPVDLTLSGPAGGVFTAGAPGEGEQIELDAVEFCRIVSGRSTGAGLLTCEVPF